MRLERMKEGKEGMRERKNDLLLWLDLMTA